jgi:hypothetical protein
MVETGCPLVEAAGVPVAPEVAAEAAAFGTIRPLSSLWYPGPEGAATEMVGRPLASVPVVISAGEPSPLYALIPAVGSLELEELTILWPIDGLLLEDEDGDCAAVSAAAAAVC